MLVEHAERCWQAERENAERLSKRATLLLSAVAALLGIGLFRLDWHIPPDHVSAIHPPWLRWAVRILLGIGALLATVAFFRTLSVRRVGKRERRRAFASNNLALAISDIVNPPQNAKRTRQLVFVRIYKAYLDLQKRNAREKRRLDHAQVILVFSVVFVVLGLLAYSFGAKAPSGRKIDHDNVAKQFGSATSRCD